jgi:hypothetical protein
MKVIVKKPKQSRNSTNTFQPASLLAFGLNFEMNTEDTINPAAVHNNPTEPIQNIQIVIKSIFHFN